MTDYIEREAVIRALERYGTTNGSSLGHHSGAIDCAILETERLPAADAVPVVRCKDCKHWHEETGYCDNHSYFIGPDGMSCSPAESPSWTMWDADDYCSDGERKEGMSNGKIV